MRHKEIRASMEHDTPTGDTPDTNPPVTGTSHAVSDVGLKVEKTSQPHVSRPGRWVTTLALLALLIAVAGAAADYVIWRQLNLSKDLLTRQSAQAESRLASLQADMRSLRAQTSAEITERLKELQTAQQDLRDTLQALNAQVRQKTGVSAALAEAEYLMRSANNHLLLDRDVSTAIAALAAADERLRATGDPDALAVRGLLADEINALSALKQTDTAGLALSLNSLIDSIDQLPLAAHSSAPPAGKAQPQKVQGWRAFLSTVWSEIKSLVVVRYDNKTAQPLLAPEQSYFLYQNLRLQLETARLALLRHDAQTFHAALTTAHKWLNTYFDTGSAAVKHMSDTLARLSTTNINPPLPQISSSLKALIELTERKSAPVAAINDGSDASTAQNAGDDTSPASPEPPPP